MPIEVSAESEQKSEWLVVLDDPRPARLQGWQSDQYRRGGHYSHSLDLKRTGQRLAKKYSLTVLDQWFIESLNIYCLVTSFDQNSETTLRKLRGNKNVKWVQPSNRFELLNGQPSVSLPLLNQPKEGPPPTLLNAINGAQAVVGIIDSAVDDSHPSISENVLNNFDFVGRESAQSSGEPHGTAIASVIAAKMQPKLGVFGVAPGAKLTVFRGCWESAVGNPNCSTLSLARALDKATSSDLDILNLSLSGPKDRVLDELVGKLVDNGALVVTAFDPKRDVDKRFPSSVPGVITVKAEAADGNNDVGENLFYAPGSKVVASPNSRSDFMQGHSIAAAYFSGVLALCIEVEEVVNSPACSPDNLQQMREDYKNSANDLILKLANKLN